MQSIQSLINKLSKDFPEFKFKPGSEFWWSAKKNTVFYNPEAELCLEYCLHELSHAILGHRGYIYDIDLVKLERDAWSYAKSNLENRFNINLDEEIIQDNLDTYREWLHSRSKCPNCDSTGIETRLQRYKCIACDNKWRVNEARICALRRYALQTK